MIFHVADPLREKIERVQTATFRSLGADPHDAVQRVNSYRASKAPPFEKQFEAFQTNPYMVLPEHPYDVSLEYFKHVLSPEVTRFDNPLFLGRLANLALLCHEFFTGGRAEGRKNIIVTSLPFLSLNGICVNEGRDGYVVYLNEGVLCALAVIFENLLPLCAHGLFGRPKKRHIERTFQAILNLFFFRSTYLDTRSNRDITMAHGHEKWYFREALGESLQRPGESGSCASPKKPSQYPFNARMAKFLALRGAFAYLLGHEFSHAYCDHHEIRATAGLDLRDPEFTAEVDRNLNVELQKFEGVEQNFENYNIRQPLEEEADAHGLACALKYSIDNELDDPRTACVVVGAAACFVIMHIVEHLSLMHDLGADGSSAYIGTHALVRNRLFSGEHPAPSSRLQMALRHSQFESVQLPDYLQSLPDVTARLCESVSNDIHRNAKIFEPEMKQSDMLGASFDAFLDDELALGALDSQLSHHAKIKKYFFPPGQPQV